MQRQGQRRQREQRRERGRRHLTHRPSAAALARLLERRPARLAGHRPDRTPQRRPERRPSAERALDLTLGSALLVLSAPALAAGALVLAARRPPGGIIERSPRVGQGGRVFTLCSLRTRRLRLDVLSRLPHVVRGDLSLVGPEPLSPDDPRSRPTSTTNPVDHADATDPADPTGATDPGGPGDPGDTSGTSGTPSTSGARHWRQELKPGLTGLAQIRSRSGMPWDEPDLLDQHYAEHRGVRLDLAILARSVRIPLFRGLLGATRPEEAHLSDTDHRRCGYSAAE
ncbi:sugar transferase [Streptomyces sp. NPDC000927]|uniref:sugar transferase n=1 Tax=unclassified Streptomyces TaxID=2593676 RepID=UPI00331C02A8